MGAPNGHEVPVIGAGLHDGAHAALRRYLGQDVVPQIAQRAAGVGQLGAAQVDSLYAIILTNSKTCWQDPVFLRSLLRLAGRKVDRRFYFSRLLPGTQRGRAGRRAACSYALLRNSFSGKWGSFTQQRPLALSSVRRTQRPPTNVTVRRQDALAHLRALPRQAPRQAIYADPPYIFPGRSMNYYGTRRRGHDLAFLKLRDALFASGLPFLLSINDVPEAWQLYSRAGSITRLCSGKNGSKPELLAVHRGNLLWRQD